MRKAVANLDCMKRSSFFLFHAHIREIIHCPIWAFYLKLQKGSLKATREANP